MILYDTMTKEKSKDDEIITTNDFYNLFLERKKLYPTTWFLFPTFTRKKNLPLDKKLFRKLIKTYLNIYFNEFYANDVPKYFPLSGELKKAKGFPINFKKSTFIETNSICWIWYLRPSLSFFSNVKLIKLKGSSSRVGKLDKEYQKNKDVSLLKTVSNELKELITNDKIFTTCKAE